MGKSAEDCLFFAFLSFPSRPPLPLPGLEESSSPIAAADEDLVFISETFSVSLPPRRHRLWWRCIWRLDLFDVHRLSASVPSYSPDLAGTCSRKRGDGRRSYTVSSHVSRTMVLDLARAPTLRLVVVVASRWMRAETAWMARVRPSQNF